MSPLPGNSQIFPSWEPNPPKNYRNA